MADFSTTEKVNDSWKHLFGILGTSNGSGAAGKMWYEEPYAATHIVTQQDIWADSVGYASSYSSAVAIAASGSVIENRSDSTSVSLVSNGTDWNITSSFIPKIGYQVSNTFPNPSYIKSITGVVDNGLGNYTITLNNNTGVSAGTAVLHRRIFLTSDPTTNGLAWFTRSIQGDSFSLPIENFLQAQRFGKGYSIRLFQANGSEILTTQGAWIFNWQKGVFLFAAGQTPQQLGYSLPLYVECFRYSGNLGFTVEDVTGAELNDTLRFDGVKFVPNHSLKADGTNTYVQHGLVVSGSLVLPSGVSPSGLLVSGSHGEFRWDNNFLYLKTDLGWGRTSLQYFEE